MKIDFENLKKEIGDVQNEIQGQETELRELEYDIKMKETIDVIDQDSKIDGKSNGSGSIRSSSVT